MTGSGTVGLSSGGMGSVGTGSWAPVNKFVTASTIFSRFVCTYLNAEAKNSLMKLKKFIFIYIPMQSYDCVIY